MRYVAITNSTNGQWPL